MASATAAAGATVPAGPVAPVAPVGTLFYAQLPQTRINTGIAQNLKTIKRIYNHT